MSRNTEDENKYIELMVINDHLMVSRYGMVVQLWWTVYRKIIISITPNNTSIVHNLDSFDSNVPD